MTVLIGHILFSSPFSGSCILISCVLKHAKSTIILCGKQDNFQSCNTIDKIIISNLLSADTPGRVV